MLLRGTLLRWLALLCLSCASTQVLAGNQGYTSNNTAGSENVSCRYRLHGLGSNSAGAALRESPSPSLPAGQYTLQLICDSPQLLQNQKAEFSFTVLTPWWQSWTARIAGLLGFALLFFAALWARQRHHSRDKERLERAVAERSVELAQANYELQEASLRDPLTGVRNRRFFNSTIGADACQAVRSYRGVPTESVDRRDLIFLLVDIDHFKSVNDQHGHDAGDRVLVQIAQRLNSVVRESDFLIRWGGEEFLVVCRSSERNDGEIVASRILAAINREEFEIGNGIRLARSCSVGWAAFPWIPAALNLSVDEILRLADRGLYLAKQSGRNQAVGLVPATNGPLLKQGEEYCLEQLLEDRLIREIRTPSEKAIAAAGSR
jgi:diguanylate cyclase (GGDEF)-like protein